MRSDFAEADDTIMVSQRVDGRWSTPQVAAFSGQWHDSEPTLSPDGQRLYFVSNRPPHLGDAPVTATINGQTFAGSNLWYVARQPHGDWGTPTHVDGTLNDGAMIYNPSVTANGDLDFSAHRADSGKAYQIYVAHRQGGGYAAPERLELGDIGHSRTLENAPSLGPTFGELYVSSARQDEMRFPKPRDSQATLQQRLQSPLNGSRNLWRFDISDVLHAHGIAPPQAPKPAAAP